jgi:hypothetical protein
MQQLTSAFMYTSLLHYTLHHSTAARTDLALRTNTAARRSAQQRALQALRLYGGTPRFENGAGGVGGVSGAPGGLGGAVFTGEFANSHQHNGLLLFLSRVLRPVWFQPVAVAVNKGA